MLKHKEILALKSCDKVLSFHKPQILPEFKFWYLSI